MSQYRLKKALLKGSITIPSSKSQTLRAILFGSLASGKTVIHQALPSGDSQAMIDACRHFGAGIDLLPNRIEIMGVAGKLHATEDVINAGNSGIVLRFCSAVGALAHNPVVVTGDYSIRHHRPMQPLIEGLCQLNVSAISMRGDGYAPVIIKGPIKSGQAIISGEDSQPVSALLIASAFAEGVVEIEVRNPGEKPWIAMTLDWFDRLGIAYENSGFRRYHLAGRSQCDGFEYRVPGDMSSAAFPIAAALVTQSEISLKNIDVSDLQGDKQLIDVFLKMGARIEIDEFSQSLHVKKNGILKGVKVDINNFVDAITILAVVACFAEGETVIVNAGIAQHKECNRIQCIAKELSKMGADIETTEDGLIIRGSILKGAELHSYHDHRMVMSLSVAALGSEGHSTISDVECVSKTFPGFLQSFNALNADIEEIA